MVTSAPARPTLDALWQAVFEDPTDLDVRWVLADALAEKGDPRGEFIALQLSSGERLQKRAAALLAAHVDPWTGAIPGVVRGSRVFERGFLIALSATIPDVTRVTHLPEWRTVERLSLTTESDSGPLLARMPLLRQLGLNADGWLVSLRQGNRTARVAWGRGPKTLRHDVRYVDLDGILLDLAEAGVDAVSLHVGRGIAFDVKVPPGLRLERSDPGFGFTSIS